MRAYRLTLAILLGITLTVWWLRPPSGFRQDHPLIGQIMPHYNALPLAPAHDSAQHGSIDWHAMEGKTYLVNIFASWCLPCQKEMPRLHAIRQLGIPIIGLAWRDSPQFLTDWLAKHGNPYQQVGLDKDGGMAVFYGLKGVPESFLVDKTGTIIAHASGELTDAWIDAYILPQLSPSDAPAQPKDQQ